MMDTKIMDVRLSTDELSEETQIEEPSAPRKKKKDCPVFKE